MDVEKLRVTPFQITIEHNHERYIMEVTQIRLDTSREIFNVQMGNAMKFIESFRPYIRHYDGANAPYPIDIAENDRLKDKGALDLVIAEIVKELEYREGAKKRT